MGSIFICGNGFDLAHGLPTQYTDFRNFLLKKFPEADKLINSQFDFNILNELSDNEFAIHLLFIAMDNVCGKNWCDFENALGYMNFEKFFPRRSEEEKVLDDSEEIISYLLFTNLIIELLKPCTKKWQRLFNKWIMNVEGGIEHSHCVVHDSLRELFRAKRDIKFINFNYTRTLQKIYGIQKVTHIHNKVGDKLVFGHGNSQATYTESLQDGIIGSSTLDDFLNSFRKNTEFQMRKYKEFFNNINADIDKVYSYGFSYSKPDKVYIKAIIDNISPNAIWFFTKYESQNRDAIRIKKIKLRKYGFKGSFDIF